MKLITKEIAKKLPRIGETGHLEAKDVKVPLKLFNPCGGGTWYITEYNEDEGLAFGYVTLGDPTMAELGYIDMNDLMSAKFPPFGLGIERDMHFGDHTLEEVMNSRGAM